MAEVAEGAAVLPPVVGRVEGAALAHAELLDSVGPVGDRPEEASKGGGSVYLAVAGSGGIGIGAQDRVGEVRSARHERDS